MAESARRASLQPPGTGMYSIIRKGDFTVSTPGMDDNNEGEGRRFSAPAGYSMITRESLTGYGSEELSDVEEVDEVAEQEEEKEEEEVVVKYRATEREGSLTRQTAEDEEVENDEVDETRALLQQQPEESEDAKADSYTDRPRMPTPPTD